VRRFRVLGSVYLTTFNCMSAPLLKNTVCCKTFLSPDIHTWPGLLCGHIHTLLALLLGTTTTTILTLH